MPRCLDVIPLVEGRKLGCSRSDSSGPIFGPRVGTPQTCALLRDALPTKRSARKGESLLSSGVCEKDRRNKVKSFLLRTLLTEGY